jgi:hypothetical protein
VHRKVERGKPRQQRAVAWQLPMHRVIKWNKKEAASKTKLQKNI